MASPIDTETNWERGWRDTKKVILSFRFWVAEVIGGGVVAALAQNPWAGLVFIVGIVVAFWMGATLSAPLRQRDDARKKVGELEGRVAREQIESQKAWDRSGRYNVPIKQVIEILSKNLADQWPEAKTEPDRWRHAVIKLRSLGCENNPVCILGHEYDEGRDMFHEVEMRIPPEYWVDHAIDYLVVMRGDGSGAQTYRDQMRPAEQDEQIKKYGKLSINEFALKKACPELEK